MYWMMGNKWSLDFREECPTRLNEVLTTCSHYISRQRKPVLYIVAYRGMLIVTTVTIVITVTTLGRLAPMSQPASSVLTMTERSKLI